MYCCSRVSGGVGAASGLEVLHCGTLFLLACAAGFSWFLRERFIWGLMSSDHLACWSGGACAVDCKVGVCSSFLGTAVGEREPLGGWQLG